MPIQAGPALKVYEVDTDLSPVAGGAALPVVFLAAADLVENGGTYLLDGSGLAMPVMLKERPYPVQGGRAYPVYLVNASDGLTYLLYDAFTTDRAAGAVNGTTSESPVETGGGVLRTVVDTGSKLTISGGLLTFASGAAASGDPGHWHALVTRAAGLTLIGQVTTPSSTVTTLLEFGWDTDQAGILNDAFSFNASGSLLVRAPAATTLAIAPWQASTTYSLAVALRSAGAFFLIKGGAFANWTMLWSYSTGTGNQYPAIIEKVGGNSFTADNIRHSTLLLSAFAALAYDTFTRANGALGLTETTDPDAQTIAAKAWTAQQGTWAIASNVAAASGLDGGGIAIATYDAGYVDTLHTVPITRAAGVGGGVVRYVDSSNYIRFSHDGTNFVVEKIVAGTPTTVITAAATYVAGADGRVIVDGTSIRAFYNNASVGSLSTISDAALQTSTLVGLYTTDTGNTFDNVVTRARGNSVNFYSTLDGV